MFKQNQLLNAFIAKADTQIELAESPQDLIYILEEAKKIKGLNRFNAFDYLLYFIVTIGALVTSAYFFWLTNENFLLFLIVLSLSVLIILGIRFRARNRRLQVLSQKIYCRDLLFDNQLTQLKSHQNFTITSLKSRFSEFSLGNHTAEIKSLIQGEYQKSTDPFTYHCYHFFYTIEKFSKSKDYKNAADMVGKPIYQQQHRYGIIIPFNAPATLTITELKLPLELRQEQYQDKTLPAQFRKRFSLHTTDPLFAKKFLNPIVISLIDSLTESFNHINLEVKNGKELLFSFTNRDLLTSNQQYSLADIEAFLVEIRGISKAPKLEHALSTLHRITKSVG